MKKLKIEIAIDPENIINHSSALESFESNYNFQSYYLAYSKHEDNMMLLNGEDMYAFLTKYYFPNIEFDIIVEQTDNFLPILSAIAASNSEKQYKVYDTGVSYDN